MSHSLKSGIAFDENPDLLQGRASLKTNGLSRDLELCSWLSNTDIKIFQHEFLSIGP